MEKSSRHAEAVSIRASYWLDLLSTWIQMNILEKARKDP